MHNRATQCTNKWKEFLTLVVSPDPTFPERKRVWLQYDIPPDPVM